MPVPSPAMFLLCREIRRGSAAGRQGTRAAQPRPPAEATPGWPGLSPPAADADVRARPLRSAAPGPGPQTPTCDPGICGKAQAAIFCFNHQMWRWSATKQWCLTQDARKRPACCCVSQDIIGTQAVLAPR